MLLVGCGIDGPCFDSGTHECRGQEEGRVPTPSSCFWGSEAMAVNEADYTTGMVQRVRQERRLWRREVGVAVWRCCCPTHTGMWWNGLDIVVCILALWMFFWDCLWASSTQSALGWELGSLRERMLLLCMSPSFRPSFRSFENVEHFRL